MYSLPKETSIVFHIGSNYGYPFCQFTCLGENTEKYITFSVPIEKDVTRTDKTEKKHKNKYLTDYKSLIVQILWQASYQILLTILLKELNVKMNIIIKNVKCAELNTKIATVAIVTF